MVSNVKASASLLISLAIFLSMVGFAQATILSVSLSSPGNDTWTNDVTPDFSFTGVSDINTSFSCELLINTAGFGLNGTTQNDTLTTITANATVSEGIRTWQIDCTDVNGTVSSEQRILNVDATPPTSTINTPANNSFTSDTEPEISFTLTDNLDGDIIYNIFVDGTVNGQSGTSGNGTQTFLNLSALGTGTHEIIIQATDEVNSTNSTPLTLSVDSTNPAVTITSPSNASTTNDTTPEITFNMTDDVSTSLNYTVFVDGSADQSNSTTNGTSTQVNLSSLAEGSHLVIVQATDEASNTANSTPLNLTIDITPPNLTGTSPNGTLSSGSASLTANLEVNSSEQATCKYDSTNTTFGSMTNTFSTNDNITHTANESHSSDGSITWYVRCEDLFGNAMATSDTIAYTVSVTEATTSSGGGGGGGGGGGSLPPLTKSGSTFSLSSSFGQYTFQHQHRTHYIRIKELTTNSVTVTITSDPVEVTLKEGEERNVDITGDGEDDMRIKVNSLSEKSASFTIGEPIEPVGDSPSDELTEESGQESQGADQPVIEPLSPPAEPDSAPQDSESDDATPIEPKKFPIWMIFIILALVLGGIVWWVMKKNG